MFWSATSPAMWCPALPWCVSGDLQHICPFHLHLLLLICLATDILSVLPSGSSLMMTLRQSKSMPSIGLYHDVWIAAIASSRTRLATLTGAMCKTSQWELRSLRVNSGMLNVIRIVTYYTLPPLESPDYFWIAMAISR